MKTTALYTIVLGRPLLVTFRSERLPNQPKIRPTIA